MGKKLLIALLSLLPAASFAATTRSGAAFLKLDTASRPSAMAGAYCAESGRLDVMHYNPGGLADLDQKELAFTHAEWLQGTRYEYLAYGQPTSIGTFALSAIRLGYGDLEGRDTIRQQTGQFSADDSAYSLGYAHRISDAGGLGTTLKLIQRTIASDHASSYALDFGAMGRFPDRPLRWGASVLNVGPGTRFIEQTDPLPLTLAVGAAYEQKRSLITLDIEHEPNDQRLTAKSGFEYRPIAMVALRTGYQFPLASTGDELWDMNHLRGGLGLSMARFKLDYALAPLGEAGLTHRFTVSLTFGAPKASDSGTIIQKAQAPGWDYKDDDLESLLAQYPPR